MQEKARIERPKSVSLQLLGWSDKNALLSSIARVPPPLRHPQPQHPRYERTLHSRQTKSCRDFKFYHYDDPRGYIIQYRRDCSSNSVPSNADGPLEMFMNLGVDEHSEKEKCRQEWRCEFLYKCQEQKERSNRRAISGAGHTLYTLEDDNITTAEADGVGLDYRESTKFDTGNIKKAQLSSSTSTQTLNKFVERTTIGSIRPTYRTQLLIPEEGGKDEAAKMDRVSSNMSNYLDLGRDPKRPTNKVSCDKVCGKDKAVNLAEIPSWTNASAMWSHKASFRPPGKIVPRTVRLQSSRPSRAELSKKKTLTSTVARSARYNAQESLGHQQAHKDALAEAQLKLDKVIPQTKRTCTIRDASDPAFARVLFTKLLHLQQEQSKMGDDYSPIRWKTREKSSLEGMSGNSTHEKSIELHKNLEVSGRPRRVLNTDKWNERSVQNASQTNALWTVFVHRTSDASNCPSIREPKATQKMRPVKNNPCKIYTFPFSIIRIPVDC
ncbi:unnamed protein product [Calicophoron daubneyi]|uniref:Uncharacterized protein n=1 Tax=Calicophoron daubneyi TaxID=300641 RepID=A0AAV2T5U4_CALDB